MAVEVGATSSGADPGASLSHFSQSSGFHPPFVTGSSMVVSPLVAVSFPTIAAPTSSGQRSAAPIADSDYGTHLRYIVDHRIAGLRTLRKKSSAHGGDSLAFVCLSPSLVCGLLAITTDEPHPLSLRSNGAICYSMHAVGSPAQSSKSFTISSSTMVTWSHSQLHNLNNKLPCLLSPHFPLHDAGIFPVQPRSRPTRDRLREA